jgi:hypothetical protein
MVADQRREGTMARYLVETPHTGPECLASLDEVLKQGEDTLAKWEWGCMSGDHRGWIVVEADSESAAKNTVPGPMRGKSKAVELHKFTPQEIAEHHKS